MSIHVHAPKMHVHRTERGEERWCFGCRKRLQGTFKMWVISNPMEDYYGPHWSYYCDGCGEDRRLGFGMEWEAQ